MQLLFIFADINNQPTNRKKQQEKKTEIGGGPLLFYPTLPAKFVPVITNKTKTKNNLKTTTNENEKHYQRKCTNLFSHCNYRRRRYALRPIQ